VINILIIIILILVKLYGAILFCFYYHSYSILIVLSSYSAFQGCKSVLIKSIVRSSKLWSWSPDQLTRSCSLISLTDSCGCHQESHLATQSSPITLWDQEGSWLTPIHMERPWTHSVWNLCEQCHSEVCSVFMLCYFAQGSSGKVLWWAHLSGCVSVCLRAYL